MQETAGADQRREGEPHVWLSVAWQQPAADESQDDMQTMRHHPQRIRWIGAVVVNGTMPTDRRLKTSTSNPR